MPVYAYGGRAYTNVPRASQGQPRYRTVEYSPSGYVSSETSSNLYGLQQIPAEPDAHAVQYTMTNEDDNPLSFPYFLTRIDENLSLLLESCVNHLCK